MHVRVDEAGRRERAFRVDLTLAAVVVVSPDDQIAADRDVGPGDRAGDDVEQPHILDDEIGFRATCALVDRVGELRLAARCASHQPSLDRGLVGKVR